jgi:hypothetical protein
MLDKLYFPVLLFQCSTILLAMVKYRAFKSIVILNLALFISKQKAIYFLDFFKFLTTVNHNLTALFARIVYSCDGGLYMPSEAADG